MAMDETLKTRVRAARKQFAAMAGTYALGVFNDNFFKAAAMLILVDKKSWIMALFSLPFILFASQAGWMADRFPKRTIVILAKIMEFVAMLFGAAGIITGSWPLICVMVIIMATQSTIFSPSLNGSIPELYPAEYVPKANATIKVIVTAAILAGTIFAGNALDLDSSDDRALGRLVVAGGVIVVSLLGVLSSFFVPRNVAADPKVKFPWAGIWDTSKSLWELRHDSLLAKVLVADVFVWLIGALQMPIVFDVAQEQFKWGEGTASNLFFAELVGVAIGGVLVTRFVNGPRWYRALPVCAMLIAVFAAVVPAIPMIDVGMQKWTLYALMLMVGIPGGMMLVPCEAFIQVRPDPRKRGEVIAAANCAAFIGMFISAGVYELLTKTDWLPTSRFLTVAVLSVVVSLWLFWALPRKDATHG